MTAFRSLLICIILVLGQQSFGQKKAALQKLDAAVTLLNKGKYNDAYMKFSEGISIDKDLGELHLGKANCAYHLNMFDTALAAIDRAMEIKGEESELYDLRGNVYFKSRKYEEAIEQFSKAIETNASSKKKIHLLNTYYNRGSSYLLLKEYKKGAKDFSKAIEMNPKFAQAYHNRGVCYIRLEKIGDGCADMQKASGMGSPRSAKYIEDYCNK